MHEWIDCDIRDQFESGRAHTKVITMAIPEEIDYLDSLMIILIKSPQLPTNLRNQISTLREARQSDKNTDEVAVPIKVREIDDEELDTYFDKREEE